MLSRCIMGNFAFNENVGRHECYMHQKHGYQKCQVWVRSMQKILATHIILILSSELLCAIKMHYGELFYSWTCGQAWVLHAPKKTDSKSARFGWDPCGRSWQYILGSGFQWPIRMHYGEFCYLWKCRQAWVLHAAKKQIAKVPFLIEIHVLAAQVID